MKIIVNEKNREKIEAAIKTVEGKASARCIGYADIVEAIKLIEGRLGISQKDMIGVEASVDPNAQHFPSAYRYIPYSTHFQIKRFPSGWALTSVYRNITKSPSNEYNLILTEDAKAAVIRRMEHFNRYDK